MSEPRRSTRTRAREEAAPPPPPDTPQATPSKPPRKTTLKRKRPAAVTKEAPPAAPAAEAAQEPAKPVLPTKVSEGQPLPTLPNPQPLDLPSNEYQDIQQSGVLSASLERSRAVWTSGTNFRLFHAIFVPPKKVADRTEEDKLNVQKQKELVRNFPQVGNVEARLVIEPHTFQIRLYGPREPTKQTQKKAAPPPTPPPMYGQWPNHGQYAPYQQHNNMPAPTPPKPSTPQQRPTPPNPPQPKPQTPAQGPTTPAPDPVIHMLAQRAGTDPELKAVMKIVAEGRASKEQLEYFQGHIQELTDMLLKKNGTAATAPPPMPPPPTPAVAAPVPLPPPPQPIKPVQQQQYASKPITPSSNQTPQQQMPPPPILQSPHTSTYGATYNKAQQNQQRLTQQAPATQPARLTYRPLVFDFIEGNGDRFYLPSYSFMEWLPDNQGVKMSFLITKMKPKLKLEPNATTPSTPASKATPAPIGFTNASMATPLAPQFNTPNSVATPATMTPATPQYNTTPRIEDFDERDDMDDIEFYQPVTVLIYTESPDILQSLARAIRPPQVVDKYMNEVFDKCKRADETYLAFRLPRDGADGEIEDRRRRESADATPTISTPDIVMGGTVEVKKRTAGRPRKSLII
ncbi:hypothetical protein BDV95DRAFT_164885 [Massariosphaeria phaeospora]|uniref:SWR1-complex protein 3 domain-containing protein n=1 Tax=Massariosphaeria phaeospora TaxID=100035 RepID=A0A7C8I2X5_9PLEO|nr:hypothetical protein BDV95DRAFT_164885 [Massariosphaeria phaeospora]